MASHLGWRFIFILLVLIGAVALVVTRPIRLGLDLRGGTQIVLEAKDTARQRVNDDTVDRTLEVLRRRVDQLGSPIYSERVLAESLSSFQGLRTRRKPSRLSGRPPSWSSDLSSKYASHRKQPRRPRWMATMSFS